MPLLDVRRLTVAYPARRGAVTAVDGISFAVEPGQVLGVVGESGCGKTTAALALMGLLPDAARVSGEVHFGGRDLLQLPAEALRQVRWKEIAMVFQGAMNALNPVYPVGDQIVEAILTHEPDLREREARARVAQLFGSVGLAADRRDQYAHQYSGGMKQRAVIAMSLACDPRLVIADEPTTALDVIVQDRILRELRRIQRARQLSMVYISHDMAVVAEIADVVAVMYAGRIVEMGPTTHLYAHPVHPYTAALMASSPSLHGPKEPLASLGGAPPDLAHPPPGCRFHPRCPRADAQCAAQDPPFVLHRDGLTAACWHPLPAGDRAIDRQVTAGDAAGLAAARAPIVEVTEVRKLYPVGRQVFRRARHFVHALDGVSVSLAEGEVLGLVGESGSGKTTLGRLIVGLETPTSGTVRVRTDGSFAAIPEIERRTFRRHVQMIFQDPYESLNPRMTIGRIVAEPLDVLAIGDAAEREARVGRMLERVGLAPATYAERYPHELSGGQRQRVAIARAMVVEPRVVVADEPTSMLDVSVRAGIMELLIRFRRELGISYLYITHDLAVARFICDRIAVLYQGVIVELGGTDAVLQQPLHPYTQALIAAVPVPDPAYRRPEPLVESSVPAAIDPAPTCRFLDRCPAATERCRLRPQPVLVERRPGHWVACDEVPPATGAEFRPAS